MKANLANSPWELENVWATLANIWEDKLAISECSAESRANKKAAGRISWTARRVLRGYESKNKNN